MHALHDYPGNASLFPHLLLREPGCPFELKLVDRDHHAHPEAGLAPLAGRDVLSRLP